MTLELLLRRTVFQTTTQWNSEKKPLTSFCCRHYHILTVTTCLHHIPTRPARSKRLFLKRKQFKTQLTKDENNKCAECVVRGLICPALGLTMFTDVFSENNAKTQKKPTPYRTVCFPAKWAATVGSVANSEVGSSELATGNVIRKVLWSRCFSSEAPVTPSLLPLGLVFVSFN